MTNRCSNLKTEKFAEKILKTEQEDYLQEKEKAVLFHTRHGIFLCNPSPTQEDLQAEAESHKALCVPPRREFCTTTNKVTNFEAKKVSIHQTENFMHEERT